MSTVKEATLVENNTEVVTPLIKTAGKEISKEYHIVSIAVNNDINKIPGATIFISDPETPGEKSKVDFTEDFKPGKEIEISFRCAVGKNSKVSDVYKGIIVSNKRKTSAGCRELQVECKDATVKMTVNKSNAAYKSNSSASDVAESLLGKYELKKSVDSIALKHPQLSQYNITDWDFMIGRIDVAGMICVVNNGEVRIKQLKLSDPPENDSGNIKKLEFGRNLFEFTADKDSKTQSDEVKILSWNFQTQKVEDTTNDKTALKENSEDKNVVDQHETFTTTQLTDEEKKSIANARKIKQELSKIKGKMKFPGTNEILPGEFVQLIAVGKDFEGYQFISGIHHEYADGDWTTEATIGWDEKFFTEQINPSHPSSAVGQPSAIQGLQIATVTEITDKDGEYRVKVQLPAMNTKEDGLYARVATLDAGKKRGTFFRPEVDDEVVIGFLNDDPSNPVMLGMLHSSALAAPLEPEKENNQKGYVSRSEIKLIFNDDEKSITIETPGKRVFEINDNAGTITVKDGDGNKIVMEQAAITIEAKQDVKIKGGKSISLEAPQISVKADAKLEVKSGGMGKLESSGILEVKGSLVKIN